jgi:hypothetical protein
MSQLPRPSAVHFDRKPIIENNTLVAITVLASESKSEEMDAMGKPIMNFLVQRKNPKIH